jgi:hypothetical protein
VTVEDSTIIILKGARLMMQNVSKRDPIQLYQRQCAPCRSALSRAKRIS